MSRKQTAASSTSTQSARRSSDAMLKTQPAPVPVYIGSGIIEAESSGSISPLAKAYETPEFQLSIDNDLSHHVAINALHLRRFRDQSQAQVAEAMATSQPKLARIEGGDENITLRTLTRLATALNGRIRFTIEPAEIRFPQLPNWWDLIGSAMVSDGHSWAMHGAVSRCDGPNLQLVVGWQTHVTLQSPSALTGHSLLEIG